MFSPGITASPPHRVALCWDKHCQLLPEVLGLTAKRVATWSSEEVRHAYTLTLCQHMKSRRTLRLITQHEGILLFTKTASMYVNNWGSVKTYKALRLVHKQLLIKTSSSCLLNAVSFVHQVASFVKGLPGCKEHAATFKTEVNKVSTWWLTHQLLTVGLQLMITWFYFLI